MIQRRPAGWRRERLCLGGLAATALTMGWLALPPAPPPSIDTGWDKLNHVLAFATLVFLAQGTTRRPNVPHLATVCAAFLYGAAIEAVQAWVPGRSSDWRDLVANAAGITLGYALAWAVWRGKRSWSGG